MPYLYICSHCVHTDLQRSLFASEHDRGARIVCPNCGRNTAERKKAYKKRAGLLRGARDMDVATTLAQRARRSTRGRPAPRLIADDADEGRDIAALALAYNPADDAGAEDDAEYVARVQFNPAMRLTADGADATCRPRAQMMALCQNALTMAVAPHLITAAAGRVDTGTTMARYLKAGRPALAAYRTLSAYTWANWGLRPPTRGRAYTQFPKLSLEWCHLVADSLGGATTGANLVAASYAANTAMLAIEQRLHAKTTIRIGITAYCCQDNVAECLDYKIIRPNAQERTILIDARNDCFTRADYEQLGQQVAAFLG